MVLAELRIAMWELALGPMLGVKMSIGVVLESHTAEVPGLLDVCMWLGTLLL